MIRARINTYRLGCLPSGSTRTIGLWKIRVVVDEPMTKHLIIALGIARELQDTSSSGVIHMQICALLCQELDAVCQASRTGITQWCRTLASIFVNSVVAHSHFGAGELRP